MVMLSRDEQPENAASPILFTLSGIIMLVKPVQPLKAELPTLNTLSGIVTLIKLAQFLKDSVGTDVPVSTTEYVAFLEQF